MAVNLSALAGAGQQFFTDVGVPLSGGKLYSYAAGTTTPQATYTTAAGSIAHANPIILDSAGRVSTGEIWLTAGSNYKFVLKTSTDTTLATWDNITGINGTGITSNASNVQYDPAGTGAVSTTVQAKLRETVSVKDFGATGDGSTDDTTAISNAITYVSTNGGAVYFPAGVYLTSASLVIDAPNVTLYGDGASQSTIQSNSASFWVIKYTDNADYLTVKNLYIKGNAVDDSTTQYGIGYSVSSFVAPEYVTISNCRFAYTNSGIVTGSGQYWSITENNFDNLMGVVSGTGYGVLAAENTAHCLFDSNKFIGSAGKGRHGIYMSVGCSHSIASNNYVSYMNQSAFVCRANVGQPGVTGNVITGNSILGGGTAATVESSAISLSGVCSYNTVSNNTIINFDNIGIAVVDAAGGGACTNNTVTGNNVIAAGLTGIQVGGAKYTNLISNYIVNASRLSPGVSRGITISSAGSWGTTLCENTQIVGNVSMGSDQQSALQMNTTVPVPINTYIGGNIFRSGATAGLAVELNQSSVPNIKYIWNTTDSIYSPENTDAIINYASRVIPINFGTVAVNATEEYAFTIVGIDTSTNWTVVISPEGAAVAGLMWCGWVSATNTVTVRVANVTTSVIDAGTLNWRATCFKHNS
jgi:hypothetical protein